MKKAKMGRPVKVASEVLSRRIQVRTTALEADQVRAAAKLANTTPSAWGRALMVKASSCQ